MLFASRYRLFSNPQFQLPKLWLGAKIELVVVVDDSMVHAGRQRCDMCNVIGRQPLGSYLRCVQYSHD